jgi:outer membrane protein assembly factor BamB
VMCVEAAGQSGKGGVLWCYDMRDELGVFPRNMTSSSVLVVGGRLYVTTSNGVDWTGKHLPAPNAPALICLDKKSGKLLARERSGISARTWVCNWSSPAHGTAGGRAMVVFGAGDGFCYGFVPDPAPKDPSDGVGTLRELWRFDCNPPARRIKDGHPIKYGLPNGPSEVIATPVFVGGRVYLAVGQEPEQGDGVGCLNCIDASKAGDISSTGLVWRYDKIGRSLSTAALAAGLLYVGEFSGIVHCFDAATGTHLWAHDTEGHIWGGALAADGKVYVGNENGVVSILAATREKRILGTIDLKDAIYSSPIAANGVLYIATQSNLYALRNGK